MNEYIQKLLSQIRNKKARPYIEKEIRDHLEDQVRANLEIGMDPESAEWSAVRDMGDPVEAGISLDRIHRPAVSWSLLLLVVLISAAGVFVQYAFRKNVLLYDGVLADNQIGRGSLRYVILGLLVMVLVYLIDYTVIAKYARILGGVIIALGIVSVFFGTPVNGANYYVSVGFATFRFGLAALMLLYVPLYGAILYKYRGRGISGLLAAILWLIVPVVIVFSIPNIASAGIIAVCLLVELTIVVLKGWFQVNKTASLVGIWSVFTVFPGLGMFFVLRFHMLTVYQAERLHNFFPAWIGSHLSEMIHSDSGAITLLGSSGKDLLGTMPNVNQDYIFTYILHTYGLLAGVLAIVLLAALICVIFAASVRQKNELGLVMGCGCGTVFLVTAAINILCATGCLFPMSTFLPFFSGGGSYLLVSYALVGIVLSIYKYKSIYPKHKAPSKRKMKLSLLKIPAASEQTRTKEVLRAMDDVIAAGSNRSRTYMLMVIDQEESAPH